MKRILVVDDDPGIMEVIKTRLEANNFQVITASDGEEGIEKAHSGMPDMIIMDIMMPKMHGGDAVRSLKNNDKTRHIPILFLTSISTDTPDGTENTGINVDGKCYPSLAKPFKSEVLFSEIKRMIGE